MTDGATTQRVGQAHQAGGSPPGGKGRTTWRVEVDVLDYLHMSASRLSVGQHHGKRSTQARAVINTVYISFAFTWDLKMANQGLFGVTGPIRRLRQPEEVAVADGGRDHGDGLAVVFSGESGVNLEEADDRDKHCGETRGSFSGS